MSDLLYPRLLLRFRTEYADLTEDEYVAYVASLLSKGNQSLKDKLIEKGSPQISTRVVYKTIEVRGKKRRVPVTMSTEKEPDAIPDHLRSDGGCLMIKNLLNLSDTETALSELLEVSDYAYDVPVGFIEEGDLVLYENDAAPVWGVVVQIKDNYPSASTFKMASVCQSFAEIEGDVSSISLAYRIV
jgi:hypothetical protein